MEIKIDPHTLERAKERGVTEDEIKDVLQNGFPVQAKHGRMSKFKVFPFERERLHRYYEEKKVEVIYTADQGKIITITVYAFYGKW